MNWRIKLSETEQIIVKLICDDCLSRKEIAHMLFRSAETISTHMKNIFSKLEVTKVTELSKIYFTSSTMILLMLISITFDHHDYFIRSRRYRRKVEIEHTSNPVTVHGI